MAELISCLKHAVKSYVKEYKLNFKVPPFIKGYQIQKTKFSELTFYRERRVSIYWWNLSHKLDSEFHSVAVSLQEIQTWEKRTRFLHQADCLLSFCLDRRNECVWNLRLVGKKLSCCWLSAFYGNSLILTDQIYTTFKMQENSFFPTCTN